MDIEAAWKRLVRQYHPDRAAPDEVASATVRTAAINEAYQTLRNPDRRARYDRRSGIGSIHRHSKSRVSASSDEVLDAFIRLRKQRQVERLRVCATAVVGGAALAYSLRALRIL
jgi:curved DNA-binding protein CbpA